MRIGIIGPNFTPHLDPKELNERKAKLSLLAKDLAVSGFEILLTPDQDSLLEFIGNEFIRNGGRKIYEIVPLDDDYENYLNTELGETISCDKWANQPAKFNEECDVMFCVGYGGMVIAEIGFSGYFNPKTVYIIKDFISAELPKEIEPRLNIEYVGLEDIKEILKGLE